MELLIRTPLPSLNSLIHRRFGPNSKKEVQRRVEEELVRSVGTFLPAPLYPRARIQYTFYRSRKMDLENIYGGPIKVVNDALQQVGLITTDTMEDLWLDRPRIVVGNEYRKTPITIVQITPFLTEGETLNVLLHKLKLRVKEMQSNGAREEIANNSFGKHLHTARAGRGPRLLYGASNTLRRE